MADDHENIGREFADRRRRARRLLVAIDVLAGLFACTLLTFIGVAVNSAIQSGEILTPVMAQLTQLLDGEALARVGIDDQAVITHEDVQAAEGLPDALRGKASFGSHLVEVRVQIREQPLYSVLWFLKIALATTIYVIAYWTIRTVCAGFAGPYAFTERGARWVRRLGVAGMVGFVAGLCLDGMLHFLGRNLISVLANDVPELRSMPSELNLTSVWVFPISLLFWILGGAMHRAAHFEREVRETI